MYCNLILRRVRVTIVAVKKAISIKYSERVSVFLPYLPGMQNACVILYCNPLPVRTYNIFPHYLLTL